MQHQWQRCCATERARSGVGCAVKLSVRKASAPSWQSFSCATSPIMAAFVQAVDRLREDHPEPQPERLLLKLPAQGGICRNTPGDDDGARTAPAGCPQSLAHQYFTMAAWAEAHRSGSTSSGTPLG
jgi:hypothetical protein